MSSIKKFVVFMISLSFVSIVAAPNVRAISANSKPLQPKLVSITALEGTSKNRITIVVVFTKATTSSKSPLLLTEVRLGKYVCNARKSATKCTIKNVPSGKSLNVSVRAKNKMGFGKSSKKVKFKVFVGASWSSGSTEEVSDSVTSYTPFVSPIDPAASLTPASTLQFDFSGAVGLALQPSVSSSSMSQASAASNLVVVLESGVTRAALSAGSASFSKFLIAPNNRLYVLFTSETNFGSVNCLLAQVYRSTGKAVCLESSGMAIDLGSPNSIQFDHSGNIYYAGSRGSSKVLRRFSNGYATDYINQFQSFGNWLVLPNGDVIVSGYTSANGLSWTRRITTSNTVSALSSESTNWMLTFPDGNAYFSTGNCVKRYLVKEQMLDPMSWLSFGTGCGGVINREWVLSVFLNSFWITANAKVLAQYTNTGLYFLYPTVKKANQPLRRITYSIPALSSMVLVGTNANGTNQMILFDSSTDTSSVIADGSNEIEFYRVQLNLSQNRIYFDGLRFSDNKYVIGYLDLATKAILSSDVLTRVQDFQTFIS